jgi:hypothetical protein
MHDTSASSTDTRFFVMAGTSPAMTVKKRLSPHVRIQVARTSRAMTAK